MLPSFHDEYVLGYSVDCLSRRIELRIGAAEAKEDVRTVVFDGVEGYRFENDAFGNIVLDFEEIAVEKLLAEYAEEIRESYRMAGAPGPWAHDLASASSVLRGNGIRAFVLSSSYGMSGWILARSVAVENAQQSL